MRRLVLGLLVLSACTSDSRSGQAAPSSAVTRATANSSSRVLAETSMVAGRDALILSPDDGQPHPTVIVLHGAKDDPQTVAHAGDWAQAVLERHIVAVFPEGTEQTWNAGTCCETALDKNVDDVRFLETLVGEVADRTDVIDERVYLVGHSNGAMMIYRYACESGAGVAGYAVVAGARLVTCVQTPDARFLAVHGTADSSVPYDGRDESVELYISVPPLPSVDESLAPFVHDCAAVLPDARFGIATVRHWTQCRGNRDVELVTLTDAKHSWPQAPIAATALILDFFEI